MHACTNNFKKQLTVIIIIIFVFQYKQKKYWKPKASTASDLIPTNYTIIIYN